MAQPPFNSNVHFPSIPVPTENVLSLVASVMALKRAVELLTETGGEDTAQHTYVRKDIPPRPRTGDFWLKTTEDMTFNLWDGSQWLVLCTLPVVPAAFATIHRDHVRSGKR